MNRRVALAKHWLFTSHNEIPLFELLTKVFEKTCDLKAKPYILEVVEEEEFLKIRIKGIPDYLYYPKNTALQSLYQVITESTDVNQWHYYEIPETKVGLDDVVVDCGSAEGLFSLMIARRCAKVYAIEPLPLFIKSLHLTFSELKNKVEVIPCALSNNTGVAYMSDNNIASALSNEGSIKVLVETVDNLFFKKGIKIDYLKADLEGYEMDMLKGAEKTIQQSKPKIAITTYHKAHHAAEIKTFLLSIHSDYKIKVKGIEERSGAPVMLHAW